MTEIDVSECAFYSKGKCNNPNGMACNCCNNAICYFKELKRLEAENKELGKIIDCKNGTIASLAKVRDELKQENKKMKEALEKIKEICKEAIKLCDCPDADVNSDCIDCTEGGRAKLAKEIMEVLKDEY